MSDYRKFEIPEKIVKKNKSIRTKINISQIQKLCNRLNFFSYHINVLKINKIFLHVKKVQEREFDT